MTELLKDSGTRQSFSTGAVRDGGQNRGAFELLASCWHALERIAQVFERGAIKYSARNWEKGIPTGTFYRSALRHLLKWGAGWRDEDHLAMSAWNILCLIETKYRIQCGILPADLETMPAPDARYGENTLECVGAA